MTFGIQFPPDERGERLLDENYKNYTLLELVDNVNMPAIFSHRGLRYAYDQGFMNTQPSLEHLYFVQWTLSLEGVFRPRMAIFGNVIPQLFTADYGMRINNAAGECIYDTRIPFLKISDNSLGPGLEGISWTNYTSVDVSGLSNGANTFILCNPFLHPFSHRATNGKFYISSIDLIYSPPALNAQGSTTLRMKKTTREYVSDTVVGYHRGFQYLTAYPIILADLDNLI